MIETIIDHIIMEDHFLDTITSVMAIEGEDSKLPCHIKRFPSGTDRAKLIMWFRNGSETPFYT